MMGVDILRKARKGVVEEGGAILIAMVLVIAAIALFLLVIIPFIMRLATK